MNPLKARPLRSTKKWIKYSFKSVKGSDKAQESRGTIESFMRDRQSPQRVANRNLAKKQIVRTIIADTAIRQFGLTQLPKRDLLEVHKLTQEFVADYTVADIPVSRKTVFNTGISKFKEYMTEENATNFAKFVIELLHLVSSAEELKISKKSRKK